ncbi:MAG: formylglycine-generating enzyme family protein, partial [Thermoguttaceae bacterium]
APPRPAVPVPEPNPPPVEAPRRRAVPPGDTAGLIETMLAQGRYALLLRPQIASELAEQQFRRALEALASGMALVPEGEVVLAPIEEDPEEDEQQAETLPVCRGRVIRVEPFFLDRYPVTNAQFYEFVAGGGYQEAALWDPTILPAVLDFVDQTGMPGPRYWKNGHYPRDQHDHPVVGVSWYEAAAYARWVGKRLPTDAEWVKAGSWPVNLSPTTRVQRRYPWGDAMDRSRANLWGSGPNGTVPVTAFAEGVSVGGVYQLIGNVWEWTRGNFPPSDANRGDWILETPMKSIRGGAFNTYLDNQATCQFQSGEAAIARKPNIGFRCAVGVCDLLLARNAGHGVRAESRATGLPEEVPA